MASSNKRRSIAVKEISKKTTNLLKEDAQQQQQLTDEIINEELQSMQIVDVPLENLYSAPAKWNEWNKLPEDKIIQLCQSIIEIGQQAPCIVWKIEKARVLSLYEPGELDSYGFLGDQYMILSGHNRAFCRKLIAETDESLDVQPLDFDSFKVVPCVVYEDSMCDDFIEKAKQIIDDTNFLSRDKTTKETMRAIVKKYKQFDQTKKRHSENVAKKIAESLNMNKVQVLKYSKINKNLIPEIQEFIFNEKISIKDGVSLCNYPLSIQESLYENYQSVIANKKNLKKFLKETTPDMTIEEIQQQLAIEEKKLDFEKVTVAVPKERLEEFNEWFKRWKQNE